MWYYISSDLDVGWLGFMAYQPFVGYLTPNPFFIQLICSISNNSV